MLIGDTQLHFVSSVVILIAAAIPVYLTIKLTSELRRLTVILSIFIFVHAVYQIVSFYGFDLLADTVFEPISAAALIYFGIVYYGQGRPQKDTRIKNMVVAWTPATIVLFMNSFTIFLLLAALSLFAWLAVTEPKKTRSFQFQLSIFITIWIVGDLVNILYDNGLFVLSSLRYVGEEIHVVSMFFFSGMLWLRYYYSKRSSKKMVENLDANFA